jgi:hypothetical protein
MLVKDVNRLAVMVQEVSGEQVCAIRRMTLLAQRRP